MTATRTAPAETLWRNETLLIGRLAAPAELRELPSGDEIAIFRLIVPRHPVPSSGQRVDTLDCVVRTPRLRQRALALPPDTVIEVVGALRRRFWRAASSPTSRCEIEVDRLTRLAVRAGPSRDGRS